MPRRPSIKGDQFPPLTIDVSRGSIVESSHLVHAVIATTDGGIVASWGDRDRLTYPRSAIKPIQAIPLIESGAAAASGIGDDQVALACASHSGEPMHAGRVLAWLTKLGLGIDDLECGIQTPSREHSAHALIRSGHEPSQVHNNCSGKHTGMLATAMHMGEGTKGYAEVGHPVQQRVKTAVAEMAGVDLSGAPMARDGCSIPTYAMPLSTVAQAMARFAAPAALDPDRKAACERIYRAWSTYPHLVAGTDRFDTKMMQVAEGLATVKAGAEGVFCAAIPSLGLGLALKAGDGASRAAQVATAALLDWLDFIPAANWDRHQVLAPPVVNRRDFETGVMRAVFPDEATA